MIPDYIKKHIEEINETTWSGDLWRLICKYSIGQPDHTIDKCYQAMVSYANENVIEPLKKRVKALEEITSMYVYSKVDVISFIEWANRNYRFKEVGPNQWLWEEYTKDFKIPDFFTTKQLLEYFFNNNRKEELESKIDFKQKGETYDSDKLKKYNLDELGSK